MRGAAAGSQGENPWEYDSDAPAQPLPRTGARDSGGGTAEPLLGD